MGIVLNPANETYMAQDVTGIVAQRLHWWRAVWTTAQTVAASATGIHAAITMQDAVAQTVTTNITQPTCARNITVTGGHADCAGVVTVYGTNINGDPISESITQNGTNTVLGTKAFKTVTSLAIPARSSANTPTVAIGTGVLQGLPLCLPAAACVFASYVNGTLEGTAATVTVDADEVEKNTVDLNTALNAQAVIVIGYIYS